MIIYRLETHPITAKGDVNSEMLRREVVVDGATRARVERRRGSPSGRIGNGGGVGGEEVGGNVGAGEEPDGDTGLGQLGSVDSSTGLCERFSVSCEQERISSC